MTAWNSFFDNLLEYFLEEGVAVVGIRKREHFLPILKRIVFVWVCAAGMLSLAGAQTPEPTSDLKIVAILFEDFQGEMRTRFSMDAGGMVSLSFEVAGLGGEAVETADGYAGESVQVTYRVELLDPQGVLLEPAKEGEVRTILGPRDADWRPKIRWAGAVPEYAASGEYRVRIQARDALDRRETVATAAFLVRGDLIRPTASLEVQQVGYAVSEEGPWFSARTYSPLEAIQVRYNVAGIQVSPDKQVWVEQDWTVRNEAGEVAASRMNAVVVKQQYFYPPGHLSTRFELRLEDPRPGRFTLRIAVRDRIGGQEATFDSDFVIRP